MASRSAKGPDTKQQTSTQSSASESPNYQSAQDSQAIAVAGGMAAMAENGKAQLQALQNQSQSYAEAFSDAASEILVSTQAQAWQRTAEKTAAKLGAYSPVDIGKVFQAFSLDVTEVHGHLRGIAEPAALMEAKTNAGV